MQPALRDVVQYFTLPASAATAGDFLAATRSLPWCGPPGRGAPKSSTYCTSPTTGKTMWAGGFASRDASAVPAVTPRSAAARRTPRAVVRWLDMGRRGTEAVERNSRTGESRSLESDAVKIAVCVKQVPE